jgi:hypothetical protein
MILFITVFAGQAVFPRFGAFRLDFLRGKSTPVTKKLLR